ncbi:MAG TPA: DUF998 domain-containing protein [Dehalococcoidia bacterium]|nr:DUF998 domain-containing protein [Dehalococcoidia bacterium]
MTLSESTLQSNTQVITTRNENSVTDNLNYKPDSKCIRYFLNKITGVGTVIAGPVVILSITIVLESIQPGYDRIYDTISRLVWGQLGWLETGCFFLFALVLIALALNLNKLNISRRSLRFTVLMISLMSVGFVIIAIIPTNAPGEPVTLTVFTHRFLADLICFLFPVVCLSMARGLSGDPTSKRLRDFSLLTGGIGIVLSIAGMAIIVTETPWKGAIERIILVNGILWIEVVGIWLLSGNFLPQTANKNQNF